MKGGGSSLPYYSLVRNPFIKIVKQKPVETQTEARKSAIQKTVVDVTKLDLEQLITLAKTMGFGVAENLKSISHEVVADDNARKITIPKSMSKLEAAKELESQWKNEEQEIDVVGDFEGWDWKDVLVAIKHVTEDVFGWICGQATFYGNPTEIDIVTDIINGKPQTTKAFYGNFKLGAWENAGCGIGVRRGTVSIGVHCKKKFSNEVSQYFNLIRQRLTDASIYRGKSIVVTRDAEKNLAFELIENKSTDNIILNKDENLVVDNFIMTSLKEPGKRCYLFTGSYGNGKTETAMKIGRRAVRENGMSFFYLKDSEAFDLLLERAKKYQPCIVFVEDIDEIASGEQRDSSMNKILNTLDGVQTKGNNLTVIFTTNHAQKINSALRRPGRIDIVIEFKNPNKATAQRIMQNYFEGLTGADKIDYTLVMADFPDVQGAVVAEVCKRAVKLYKNTGELSTDTVLASLASMSYQIELMNGTPDKTSPEQKFVALYKNLLLEGKLEGMDDMKAQINQIHSATC